MTSIIGLKKCCLKLGSFLIIVVAVGLGARASRGENISLTVDATQTPQRILHAKLVIPVKPGPLTLYYPKWLPGEHGPDGPIGSLTGLQFEADGRTIPWQRDLLDVYTFHVDVPAGATHLNASYDYIEPDGYSATDKLLVMEWNEVVLYPAGRVGLLCPGRRIGCLAGYWRTASRRRCGGWARTAGRGSPRWKSCSRARARLITAGR